ncbi:hypothetical protein EYF80_023536 [Liparis tanakae]|uniref:Uncharacterized protein n=1 Tax=Liparis tanakae TaxID=230148 RepID=A0A4Z2HK97_9TELE|nr:hypothetical protein EYF80_023536 [Liparis tanakae]
MTDYSTVASAHRCKWNRVGSVLGTMRQQWQQPSGGQIGPALPSILPLDGSRGLKPLTPESTERRHPVERAPSQASTQSHLAHILLIASVGEALPEIIHSIPKDSDSRLYGVEACGGRGVSVITLTRSPDRGLFFGRVGKASSFGLVSMAQYDP